MLREEGGGSVEEGSRVICVETSGVRGHIVSSRNGVYTNLQLLVPVYHLYVSLVGVGVV